MEEECPEEFKMDEKSILKICAKRGMYITPECNDVLHLENAGFLSIDGLERFLELRVLWLSGNQFSKIEGLNTLKKLQTLYLSENCIEHIEGLDELDQLENLILSFNYIRKIEGLEKCKSLTFLDLEANKIGGSNDCLDGIRHCENLQILRLTNNKLTEIESLDVLETLKDLRVLHLDGNPVVRQFKTYRRTLISTHKNLRHLDDTPVTDEERRTVSAWAIGGKEAEMKERQKISAEKNERDHDSMKEFRRMQREAAIAAGKDIRRDHPELLSSDDEEAEKLIVEKYQRMAKLEEGPTPKVQELDELD
ncbi:Leucine Rich Repeat family protein [Trichomonas vaginalis G3]|uniref:Leucine Rich Repeat family protein n=1 Tax=Trichomonas vaginalis (strain ATCC PRA-98 / G3) TaxID=412133 RepID=A2FW22_TRIV3|nr:uncharacterized protein TVAGG3_0623390 [Trichomonas vaginalis G3]EAX90893.1 Leucine Rich Repeat family protein [Trichomonas vaginalis G3]KAI5504023.1 axoneme assembly [Trichomonas vaginalis G3]|eukprot:XP_001303823.1 hypothetical protein [Trichomonas vaginalis G3]